MHRRVRILFRTALNDGFLLPHLLAEASKVILHVIGPEGGRVCEHSCNGTDNDGCHYGGTHLKSGYSMQKVSTEYTDEIGDYYSVESTTKLSQIRRDIADDAGDSDCARHNCRCYLQNVACYFARAFFAPVADGAFNHALGTNLPFAVVACQAAVTTRVFGEFHSLGYLDGQFFDGTN